MRDDIRLIPLAEELGYKVDRGKDAEILVNGKLPTYTDSGGQVRAMSLGAPYSFIRGSQHIWFCRLGWACADLIDRHFRNHRYYPWLEMALRIESSPDRITNCPKCGAKNRDEGCKPRCHDCPMDLYGDWATSIVWLNIKKICPDMISGREEK